MSLRMSPGRVLRRSLLVIASVLLALTVLAAVGWPLNVTLWGLRLSANRPARLLVEAAFVLVIWAILAGAPRRAPRLRTMGFLALLALLFVSLCADSHPRRAGDGGEYVAMTLNLARLRPPALSDRDMEEIERTLKTTPGFEQSPLRVPRLRGADGRQDFPHFWFYSLAAVPFVAASQALGLHPNHGFAVLNLVLLLGAAAVMLRDLSPPLAGLVLCGPILWWIDKAHTEVATFSLLSIGLLTTTAAPWWALLAVGAASTQNPPLTALYGLVLGYAFWSRGLEDRRVWAGAIGGGLLCALHPLYYRWHLGITSSLQEGALLHWPSFTAWLTPLLDPNLGIVEYFPGWTLVVSIGIILLAARRTTAPGPVLTIGLVTGLVLLFVFAQTANVNHGATPGPSRYGLWLVPLAVGVLLAVDRVTSPSLSRIVAGIAAVSVAFSGYVFHPRLPDRSTVPSLLADWLWSAWPAADNPLPEVFAERVSGVDGPTFLPITTRDCTKVLLEGTGSGDLRWPIPCEPGAAPDVCRRAGVLCYANRGPRGYTFTMAPAQPAYSARVAEAWTWTAHDATRLREFGDCAPQPIAAGRADSLITPKGGIGWIHALQCGGRMVAWVVRADLPSPQAPSLEFRVRGAGTVASDAETGAPLARLDIAQGVSEVTLPDVPLQVLRLTPR